MVSFGPNSRTLFEIESFLIALRTEGSLELYLRKTNPPAPNSCATLVHIKVASSVDWQLVNKSSQYMSFFITFAMAGCVSEHLLANSKRHRIARKLEHLCQYVTVLRVKVSTGLDGFSRQSMRCKGRCDSCIITHLYILVQSTEITYR